MKVLLFGAVLLSSSVPVNATTIQNFNIFLTYGIPAGVMTTDKGTYTIADGQLSAFRVIVSGCLDALVRCNFQGASGADPFDNIPSDTVSLAGPFDIGNGMTGESVLHLFESSGGPAPHQFTVHTVGSFDPSGTYFAVATPEPSTWWLLFAGSVIFTWMKKFLFL